MHPARGAVHPGNPHAFRIRPDSWAGHPAVRVQPLRPEDPHGWAGSSRRPRRHRPYEWLGHSIGWWERDTFVIDTVGFNDQTWLDRLGHPHSDALHLVERLRLVDPDTLEYGVTVNDSKAYEAPWEGRMIFTRRADWGILEHICTTKGDEYLEYKQRAWEATR